MIIAVMSLARNLIDKGERTVPYTTMHTLFLNIITHTHTHTLSLTHTHTHTHTHARARARTHARTPPQHTLNDVTIR